jgi:hypothetical protein
MGLFFSIPKQLFAGISGIQGGAEQPGWSDMRPGIHFVATQRSFQAKKSVVPANSRRAHRIAVDFQSVITRCSDPIALPQSERLTSSS